MTTAGCKHATTIRCGHALAETVFVATLADGWLECSFHFILFLYFHTRECKGSLFGIINKIFVFF